MKSAPSQLQAVGLALAGYTCWVFADTSLKIVGASALPAYEVIALVGLATCALLLVYALCRRDLRALWPRNPTHQLLRSTLDLANNLCVVIALRHLPLALFYILVFFAPLATTLLAAVFLGEALEWRKTVAILVGLLGVIVAVDPFALVRASQGHQDWTGYLACLVCVACFSTSTLWLRGMTQTESSESLTFSSGALMAVTGGLAMLAHSVPVALPFACALLATGLFCVIGSLCFYVALRHASAATVTQYHYSQLLTGALIAYLLWHETLTPAMLLGATLIIGSGASTAALCLKRQNQLQPAVPSAL